MHRVHTEILAQFKDGVPSIYESFGKRAVHMFRKQSVPVLGLLRVDLSALIGDTTSLATCPRSDSNAIQNDIWIVYIMSAIARWLFTKMAQKKAGRPERRPDLCIKLRSWCDQWVSVALNKEDLFDLNGRQLGITGTCEINETDILKQVRVACQRDLKLSSLLVLKPRNDGKYDLQLFAEEQDLKGSGSGAFLGFHWQKVGSQDEQRPGYHICDPILR
jgi:hypothetical protein